MVAHPRDPRTAKPQSMVKPIEQPRTPHPDGGLPGTIGEAVDRLLDLLSDHDGLPLRPELDAVAIESLHVSLGPYIRREFGLWGRNEALLADCGCDRAEDAYVMILEALAKRLEREGRKAVGRGEG